MTKYWLEIRFQHTILWLGNSLPGSAAGNPQNPRQVFNIYGAIIPLHLRLTQERSCKQIPDKGDDGLRPSL